MLEYWKIILDIISIFLFVEKILEISQISQIY